MRLDEQVAMVQGIVARHGQDRTRLMDIAREVHQRFGHISPDSIRAISGALGIPCIEVRDMVSFYAHLATRPQGRTVVRLCHSVVERMHGADAVAAAFEAAVGVPFGETTADGAISLAYAPCVGLSDQAPSALINNLPFTNLRPEDVPQIVDAIRAGADLHTLPQAGVYLNLSLAGPVIFRPMERGAAIRRALAVTPKEVLGEIMRSKLRGRGGAGFPTARKWQACRDAPGDRRFVICNADEGEPGTFKDRVVLTENPNLVLEGMTVAGYAIGAEEGILYLRGEYEYLRPALEQAIAKRRHLGLLGRNILGNPDFHFDIRIQMGAGAYICGEESALIESMEGKRGAPRERPPFPVERGFLNQPSIVNNVATFCCAARIIEHSGEWFAAMGTAASTGTKLLSISGDVAKPGVYEVEYGITIRELLKLSGGGQAQAVLVGGPSGVCLSHREFWRQIAFEDVPTGGSFIVFGPDRDVLEYMRQFVEFFVEESCGWCVPCRVGTTLLLRAMDKVVEGRATRHDLDELRRLCATVKGGSRCGLGQTAGNPILSTMEYLPELFEARLCHDDFTPAVDLDAALRKGAAAAGRPLHEEVSV
jgi:[NiFe] hydrogenase diaphorase moiety large subunit